MFNLQFLLHSAKKKYDTKKYVALTKGMISLACMQDPFTTEN